MIYVLFIAFVCAVAVIGMAAAIHETHGHKIRAYVLQHLPWRTTTAPIEDPSPTLELPEVDASTVELPAARSGGTPPAEHEQLLLDVYMAGYHSGYMTAHTDDGCQASQAHLVDVSTASMRKILSDPIPRQVCADTARAIYYREPEPYFGLTAIPLGRWDPVQGGDL
jgi:hypothetical protein